MQQNMTTHDAYLQATAGVGYNRMFPEGLPCTLPPGHAHHGFNPVDHYPTNRIPDQDPCLYPPPPPSTYEGLFSSSMFGRYDGQSSAGHLRLLSDAVLGQVIQPCTVPFGLQAEIGSLTAQEIMDAKALAASKSHSEAERRRRERINNHLAKLRSLLPSTTKTDKASLLAEVIQHVKELKRQTSIISEYSPLPTEMDELTFDNDADEEGKLVIKASICCEDRSDLLPDLIKTLKALRLRTLKAEITTLGRRVKNVLFITGDDDQDLSWNYEQETPHEYSISSIEEALKEVMKKRNGDECSSGSTHVN